MARARRTRIDSSTDADYHRALGEFLHEYSGLEAVMFWALTHYAGVRWEIGRAIFSGVRVEQSISFIKRVMEVADPGDERRTELIEIFRHLSAINETRNSLIHYGSFVTDDMGRITSNVRVAHITKRIKDRPASLELLQAMTADVLKVSQHLIMHCAHPRASFSERASENPVLTAPWQYTIPEQP